MKAEFICHPDFKDCTPLPIFRKQFPKQPLPEHPENFRNRHTLFRKKLTLKKFDKATIRISADDYYKLYVNGEFVCMGPASMYPWAYYYNEVDLSAFLKEGENTIAVHTYYQGYHNHAFITRDLRAMMWCELYVDEALLLVSDESWKYHTHTGYSHYGLIGYETAVAEEYDSRSPETDFYKSDFDDSAWEYAAIYKNADYSLIKQPTSTLEVYDVAPEKIEERPYGRFIDFGREMVGYMKLRAVGKSGDEIILRYSEELTEDNRVRYDMRCNCLYEEKWILSGNDDLLMQFDYKAFRYAEIIMPEGVELKEILMSVRHYPYEERAVYETENEDLLKIIRLCADTTKYGTQDNYVDCPTREKGQYLGDVSIAARAQAVLTGKADMMKKAVLDFCYSTKICPGIMAVTSGSLMQEIADYSLQFASQLLWIYSFDGDIDFLRKTEPYATGAYNYFLKFTNADGLLDEVNEKWNLVDWPQNLRDNYDFNLTQPIGKGLHNVINAFWVGFLSDMDELYETLGMQKTGMTEKVKKAFIDTFYSEKTGLFCDSPCTEHSAVHSNILPLLFEIGTEDEALKARIFDLIEKKGLHSTGVYIAYFTLAALIKNGRRDLAEKLATAPECWMNMLCEGATTTFEAWGKDQKGNCSLFHPWATAPAIVFAKGIRVY